MLWAAPAVGVIRETGVLCKQTAHKLAAFVGTIDDQIVLSPKRRPDGSGTGAADPVSTIRQTRTIDAK